MTNTIYMLIGVPGSGKSTWTSKLEGPKHVISTDNIIDAIAASKGTTYDDEWSDNVGAATASMWNEFQSRINRPSYEDIVIDRTNMNKKSRAQFFKKCYNKSNWKWIAVVFKTPDDSEWRRRLNSRPGKTIPASVLRSMQESYVAPSFDEGFDAIMEIDN